MPASQAGRHGFESRLPLQNQQLTSLRKSYTTFHYIKHSVHQDRLFELPGGFGARLSRRLGVDIQRNADPMAPLVSLHLRIDARLMAQGCVSPPHDLEIHPIQPVRLQFRLDLVRQHTVPPERLSSFTRKYERFRIAWDRHLQPMAEQRGRFRRHSGRTSRRISLRIIQLAAVDPLLNPDGTGTIYDVLSLKPKDFSRAKT